MQPGLSSKGGISILPLEETAPPGRRVRLSRGLVEGVS